MSTDFTTTNHYVPQWYQQRFIPRDRNDRRYHYLDMKPVKVNHPDGGHHFRAARRILGPISCFEQEHLYTVFFGGSHATDAIEKQFFGTLDNDGAAAVAAFQEYEWTRAPRDAWQNLMRFVGAQKLRTPKGLDFIKLMAKRSHQDALMLMQTLCQMNVTIWMECCWEVLYCDQSPTKFIVSDHPVATYNKQMFPLSKYCAYPNDAPIAAVGTHTIFPLGLDRCFVLTNLGYVRDPKTNPLKERVNPRMFQSTMFDLRKVQVHRQISEQEVRAINFIMKSTARRYIAAAEKEWLYPEKHLPSTMWNKLGDQFFLMPDPRKMQFSTDFLVGYKDGGAWGVDEYGRAPGRDKYDAETRKLRDHEFKTFHRHRELWESKFGKLTPEEREKLWL